METLEKTIATIAEELKEANRLKKLEIATNMGLRTHFGNLNEYFYPEQIIRRIFNEIESDYFWSDRECFEAVDNSCDEEILAQISSYKSSNNTGL